MENLPKAFENLGWPSGHSLAQEAAHISSFFDGKQPHRDHLDEAPYRTWITTIQDMDEMCLDGRLGTNERSESRLRDVVCLALHIAHVLLSGATQKRHADFSRFPSPALLWSNSSEEAASTGSWLLNPLLSPGGPTVSALEYFKHSLSHCKGSDERRNGKPNDFERSYPLALASRGQVAVAGGLLEPPRDPAEAFQVIVMPGNLI